MREPQEVSISYQTVFNCLTEFRPRENSGKSLAGTQRTFGAPFPLFNYLLI